MGDRGNLGIIQPSGDVLFIYTHWTGSTLLNDLAQALAVAEPRWSDTPYATRVVVSQIIGDKWEDTNGYGLSINTPGDAEQPPTPTPLVSFGKRTVSLYEPHWGPDVKPALVWTFTEFLDLYGP
jgi:hypothetical protein